MLFPAGDTMKADLGDDIMWGILVILIWLIPGGAVTFAALLAVGKWLDNDAKKHPEQWKDTKPDNFCYWTDD